MKIRVSLITGATIDFDAPPDFNLVAWIVSVRETGRWLIDHVYVRADAIVSVMKLTDDLQPIPPKVEGSLQ